MMIECPSCGRTGSLPALMPAGTSTLRCRKCQGRFVIGAWRDNTSRAGMASVLRARVVISPGSGENEAHTGTPRSIPHPSGTVLTDGPRPFGYVLRRVR